MYDPYMKALKKRVIKEYIEENKEAPSRSEIFELLRKAKDKYPHLNVRGFSSVDIELPDFQSPSSASKENSRRAAIADDYTAINDKITQMITLLEDSYRGFICTTNRCTKLSKAIDARLDNLLLLSGRSDVFVYGIEETFDTAEFVDLDASTVQVHPGYCTLSRQNFEKTDLNNIKFRIDNFASRGITGSKNSASPKHLLEADGVMWRHKVHSQYEKNTVTCNIVMDLNAADGIYIGDIKLIGNPVEVNSKTYATVHYSVNGSSFVRLDPPNRRFQKGENLFSIGKENVKKIKISLTKRTADYQRFDGLYSFDFSLDFIEVVAGKYTITKEDTLYAGPYYIEDDLGKPVNFSMATLDHGTCCIVPDATSVNFYLSKDNQTWYPASFNANSNSIVQFYNSNPHGTSSLIDPDVLSEGSLITDPLKIAKYGINYRYGEEALINLHISSEYADHFVLQNCFVRRNPRTKNKKVFGISSGWFADRVNLQYKTTIHIEAFEGAVLDLGNTSAYLNDKLVTGKVNLPRGYHNFKTSFTNWSEVPEGIMNTQMLREHDKNYPFNHKLMIEGYNYPANYYGDKIYNGLNARNFAALLEYVSPERFNSPEFKQDLSIYTIEEYNNNLFFKVKIDPSDSSWTEEEIEVKYMLRLDEVNTLYVKAILRTADTAITPNINSFRVRVV